jgi:hypothetical protein
MTVKELQEAVAKLSREELAEFRDWFIEYDWDEWDKQIASDVDAGRLDHLIEEARGDIAAGKIREL